MATENKKAKLARSAIVERIRDIGARLVREASGNIGQEFLTIAKTFATANTCADNWESIDNKIARILNQTTEELRGKRWDVIRADFPKLASLIDERIHGVQFTPLAISNARKSLLSWLLGVGSTSNLTEAEDFEKLSVAELRDIEDGLVDEISNIERNMLKIESDNSSLKQEMSSIWDAGRTAFSQGNSDAARRQEVAFLSREKDVNNNRGIHDKLASDFTTRTNELRALRRYIWWRTTEKDKDISGLVRALEHEEDRVMAIKETDGSRSSAIDYVTNLQESPSNSLFADASRNPQFASVDDNNANNSIFANPRPEKLSV